MTSYRSGGGIRAQAAQVFAPLIDLVYPPRCPICGNATADQGGLCAPCWSELVIPGEPACATCSRPFPSDMTTGDGVQCAVCLERMPKHSGIYAATIYNDASRKLILSFKHGRKLALARQIAEMIGSKLPQTDGEASSPLLVPVPLHRWRLWRRGYNQSALLALELEKFGKGKALVEGLYRIRNTPMLGGMRRKQREKTLSGAVRLNPPRATMLSGQDVMLVDDVLSSGATSDACTRVLLKGGARSVSIACFARVMSDALHGEHRAIIQGPKT
ncbi:MAG: ComF family protein [Altererythrobacter sp.]|nr:ComF family protein [Altererythrobacter sp.]